MQNSIHIFLADDDADDRGLFYEAIRSSSVKAVLTTASNGDELIRLLVQTPASLPRIVFLDLNMPIKNGHEALIEIRKNDALKTIPVIIYSTSIDPQDTEKSFEEGADFYIEKPTSFNDLKYIIKSVLSRNLFAHKKPTMEGFVIKAMESKP